MLNYKNTMASDIQKKYIQIVKKMSKQTTKLKQQETIYKKSLLFQSTVEKQMAVVSREKMAEIGRFKYV